MKRIDLDVFREPMVELSGGGKTYTVSAFAFSKAVAGIWREYHDAKDLLDQLQVMEKFPDALVSVGLPAMSPTQAKAVAESVNDVAALVIDAKNGLGQQPNCSGVIAER